MKVVTTLIFLFCILSLSSCTKPINNNLPNEDLQKVYGLVVKDKYKNTINFEQLLAAADLFFNEHYSSHKNNVSDQIADNTYKHEEEMYLISNLSKIIDKHPQIVIPRLISFYQYGGADVTEYITESIRTFFNDNPRVFIESMGKQNIVQYLEPNFNNDDFVYNTIYQMLSEPLSEEYLILNEENQKEYVAHKLKGISVNNEFYSFLKKEYNLK